MTTENGVTRWVLGLLAVAAISVVGLAVTNKSEIWKLANQRPELFEFATNSTDLVRDDLNQHIARVHERLLELGTRVGETRVELVSELRLLQARQEVLTNRVAEAEASIREAAARIEGLRKDVVDLERAGGAASSPSSLRKAEADLDKAQP